MAEGEYVTKEDCKNLRNGICDKIDQSKVEMLNKLEIHDLQAKQIIKDVSDVQDDVDCVKDTQKEFDRKLDETISVVKEVALIQKKGEEDKIALQKELLDVQKSNMLFNQKLLLRMLGMIGLVVAALVGLKAMGIDV